MTSLTSLTVVGVNSYLDGGTVVVDVVDNLRVPHQVKLEQHMFTETGPWPPQNVPGRLYFDEMAVPVRSSFERTLLQLLRVAEVIPRDAREALFAGNLLVELIDFVESMEYMTLAEKMDRAGGSSTTPTPPNNRWRGP